MQPGVEAPLGQQGLVGAHLGDAPLVHDHDAIGLADRAQLCISEVFQQVNLVFYLIEQTVKLLGINLLSVFETRRYRLGVPIHQ